MRGVFRFFIVAVVLLAIAWLGLWWYAETRLENGISGWAAHADQLSSQGFKISYDSLTKGRSPLAASVTLTGLVINPPQDPQGRVGSITLPAVTLRIDAFHPTLLHTDLPNRIAVTFGNQVNATIAFGTVTLTQRLDPHVLLQHRAYPYRGVDFTAREIDILASGSLLVFHMDGINIHSTANPDAGAGAQALSGTDSFDGMAISPLMTRMLSIPFDGKITHLGITTNLSGPVPDIQGLRAQLEALPPQDFAAQRQLFVPVIHGWAAAGGGGNASINLVIGPTLLTAAGTLKFDAAVQPEGTVTVTADHLDQLIAAITAAYPVTQSYAAQAEARLSPYLTANNQTGQTLSMQITYGNGAVSINGQKTGSYPAVNWAALANPPPQ